METLKELSEFVNAAGDGEWKLVAGVGLYGPTQTRMGHAWIKTPDGMRYESWVSTKKVGGSMQKAIAQALRDTVSLMCACEFETGSLREDELHPSDYDDCSDVMLSGADY